MILVPYRFETQSVSDGVRKIKAALVSQQLKRFDMRIVETSDELAKVCKDLATGDFVTVDTEFLRESTFWPELCLIQMASPETFNNGEAYIVDPLADGIDLTPFFDLMSDQNVVKVFHAARQDVEIVYKLGGLIPSPIFDTQVAAMVCGFGDSISYDQLVLKIKAVHIDKSSRFTDWRRRPLSEKQLNYAAADVTHLRSVYRSLKASLEEQNRTQWVSEEMEVLTSVGTYEMLPTNAWKRLKLRVRKPRDLQILKTVAEWREATAQENNVPRGRIVKDEAIYELAGNPPRNFADLGKMRGLSRGFDKNRYGDGLLAAIHGVLETPVENLPRLPKPKQQREGCSAATEMLKLLLKLVADQNGVAAKVIATVDDLEKIAANDEADVSALKGWRKELFGEKAILLKHGKIAIGYKDRSINMLSVCDETQTAAE